MLDNGLAAQSLPNTLKFKNKKNKKRSRTTLLLAVRARVTVRNDLSEIDLILDSMEAGPTSSELSRPLPRTVCRENIPLYSKVLRECVRTVLVTLTYKHYDRVLRTMDPNRSRGWCCMSETLQEKIIISGGRGSRPGQSRVIP